MRALVRAVATVADYTLFRSVAATPRICSGCGRTFTRLTPAQCTEIGARRLPSCRRWRCGGRLWPVFTDAVEAALKRALAAEETRINSSAAASGWTPDATACSDGLKGADDMTTIIQRHARDLHAGDVITHDPDHDRPVRWRVSRPPVFTRGGEFALTNVTDLATGDEHVTYYRALQNLAVEPVGGAS